MNEFPKVDYSKTREQLGSEAKKIMSDFCASSIHEAIKEKEVVGMKYKYLKGCEKDFEGASDSCASIYCSEANEIIAERRPITDESDLNECIGQDGDLMVDLSRFINQPPIQLPGESYDRYYDRLAKWAETKKPEAATEEFIDDFATFGKYDRQCKGVVIDVYDVLQAFEVVNPALQHMIKKALCAGLRGHKKREQDLVEILESAKRAIELEGE